MATPPRLEEPQSWTRFLTLAGKTQEWFDGLPKEQQNLVRVAFSRWRESPAMVSPAQAVASAVAPLPPVPAMQDARDIEARTGERAESVTTREGAAASRQQQAATSGAYRDAIEADRAPFDPQAAAAEAEDVTWRSLLDIDDVFLPPTYQPLRPALVRRFANDIASELLGRELTREEAERAVKRFRAVERSAYGRQVEFTRQATVASVLDQAITQSGLEEADDPRAAQLLATLQSNLANNPELEGLINANATNQITQLLQQSEGRAFSREEVSKAISEFRRQQSLGVEGFSIDEQRAEFGEALNAQLEYEHPFDALGTQMRRMILAMRGGGPNVV